MEDGDTLLKPLALAPESSHLAMFSTNGRLLVVDLAEFKRLAGGGRGTVLMALDDDDRLAQWVAIGPAGLGVSGIYRNKATSLVLEGEALAEYIGKRARKGKVFDTKIKQPVFAAA